MAKILITKQTGMPVIAESHSLGQSVELGEIDQELKKLWQTGEDARTRASLINFAVYSETPGSLEKNSELIAQITENHACRAILVAADCKAKENRVEAWVNAHCHITRAGGKQICSEQLSFRLEGPCATLLPSIVFSHLDSDLPLYLWWQEEFPEAMDPQFWAWVDRLIFDSQRWKNFDVQMHRVETAQHEAKERIVLCDLNWTRLDKVRYAIAQFFDHPASHHHFAEIEKITLDFAPGFRSTAILLIGWLAAQLNWHAQKTNSASQLQFADQKKRQIVVELGEREGAPIGEIILNSSGIKFRVAPAECGDLLEVSRSGANENGVPQMMPAQSNDPVELITEELLRGGPHRVYLRAVNCIREFL